MTQVSTAGHSGAILTVADRTADLPQLRQAAHAAARRGLQLGQLLAFTLDHVAGARWANGPPSSASAALDLRLGLGQLLGQTWRVRHPGPPGRPAAGRWSPRPSPGSAPWPGASTVRRDGQARRDPAGPARRAPRPAPAAAPRDSPAAIVAAICWPGFTSYSARALRMARTMSMIRPMSASAASSRPGSGHGATISAGRPSALARGLLQVAPRLLGHERDEGMQQAQRVVEHLDQRRPGPAPCACASPRYMAILLISRYQSQNSLQKNS